MESRKLLGFAIGVLLFLITILFGAYAFYSWKSGNTDVTFNIGDSYFYCETGQNVSETGLVPVLDYQSTTSKYTFKVNNIGKSDSKFSVTLNISEISESLKSTSLKYKLMVDKTGSSNICDTSSNCIEVVSGDFSKMKKGINTIAPSIDLPNNSRYQYYLFIYIDGNMQNDTSMQNGTLKMAIEVCDIIVTLDYNGGNVVDNKEYIKVASLYTGLPNNVSRNTSKVTYDTVGGSGVSNDSVSYTFDGWYLENTFKNKVTASTEVKSTVNHTLYAKWNPSKTVTLPVTTKIGYTFVGWYNGSSYVGAAGGSYSPSTSITLTAHWNANKYTVTLDNQGATTAGTTSIYETYGSKFSLTSGGNAMTTSSNPITRPTRSYTVTYNYNGSGQSNTSATASYMFGGYYTGTSGSGTQYINANGYLTTSASNTYFNANGMLYAKWSSGSVILPTPSSRVGYTFDGWYTSSSGGTKVGNAGSTYTPTTAITLYAHWSAQSYTITLNNQSATSSGTTSICETYSSKFSLTCGGNAMTTSSNPLTVPKKSYGINFDYNGNGQNNTTSMAVYSFEGYYTGTNGSGTKYIDRYGYLTSNASNTYFVSSGTLYAYWTNASSITLPTPNSRVGYTFDGWYTSSSGGTKVGNAGSSYTPTTATTLYAHWSAQSYTITLNNQSATSAGTTSICETYGSKFSLTCGGNAMTTSSNPITKPLKRYTITYDYNGGDQSNSTVTANYTFNGYYTSTGGSGVQYINSNGFLTYNANDTYFNTSGTLYAYWTNANVILPTPSSRTGYTFKGWYTASSGGTKVGDAGSTYNPTATTTLYAQWTANTYTITYDSNNGAGTMATTTFTYGQSGGISLPVNTYTKTGYTFKAWHMQRLTDNYWYGCTDTSLACTGSSGNTTLGWYSSSSIKVYYEPHTSNASSPWIISSAFPWNMKFVAQWKANTYSIKYNSNGGKGTMSNTSCTYNANCTLRANAFSKSGYQFFGWAKTSGGAAEYGNSGTVKNLASSGTVNLYAVWKPVYTATFNYVIEEGKNLSLLYNNDGKQMQKATKTAPCSYTYPNTQCVVNVPTTNFGTNLSSDCNGHSFNLNKLFTVKWNGSTSTITLTKNATYTAQVYASSTYTNQTSGANTLKVCSDNVYIRSSAVVTGALADSQKYGYLHAGTVAVWAGGWRVGTSNHLLWLWGYGANGHLCKSVGNCSSYSCTNCRVPSGTSTALFAVRNIYS